jgi:hypothetical protein
MTPPSTPTRSSRARPTRDTSAPGSYFSSPAPRRGGRHIRVWLQAQFLSREVRRRAEEKGDGRISRSLSRRDDRADRHPRPPGSDSPWRILPPDRARSSRWDDGKTEGSRRRGGSPTARLGSATCGAAQSTGCRAACSRRSLTPRRRTRRRAHAPRRDRMRGAACAGERGVHGRAYPRRTRSLFSLADPDGWPIRVQALRNRRSRRTSLPSSASAGRPAVRAIDFSKHSRLTRDRQRLDCVQDRWLPLSGAIPLMITEANCNSSGGDFGGNQQQDQYDPYYSSTTQPASIRHRSCPRPPGAAVRARGISPARDDRRDALRAALLRGDRCSCSATVSDDGGICPPPRHADGRATRSAHSSRAAIVSAHAFHRLLLGVIEMAAIIRCSVARLRDRSDRDGPQRRAVLRGGRGLLAFLAILGVPSRSGRLGPRAPSWTTRSGGRWKRADVDVGQSPGVSGSTAGPLHAPGDRLAC